MRKGTYDVELNLLFGDLVDRANLASAEPLLETAVAEDRDGQDRPRGVDMRRRLEDPVRLFQLRPRQIAHAGAVDRSLFTRRIGRDVKRDDGGRPKLDGGRFEVERNDRRRPVHEQEGRPQDVVRRQEVHRQVAAQDDRQREQTRAEPPRPLRRGGSPWRPGSVEGDVRRRAEGWVERCEGRTLSRL